MSSEAVDWALKFKGITASQRMVLLGLAHHADPSGKRSYPSLATLAGYADLSDRQVRRLLRQLEGGQL